MMAQHFAVIPFPLLAAREARISREKYLRKARASDTREEREWNLVMSRMMKRHEGQWMETYKEDFPNV